MAGRSGVHKTTVSSPVLRHIVEKRRQIDDQILRGVPKTYDEYRHALGMRETLLDLETYTTEILTKTGDIVDVE